MGNKTKVAIGLSGGVDSAVSAYLLKESGFDVTGIFLKVYEETDSLLEECPWRDDMKAAQEVATHLEMPFISWNFSKEYKKTVLTYFFDELKKGRTPNPDVFCNNEIKFGLFLSKVLQNNFDYFATGHYAQIKSKKGEALKLLRGVDKNKDQSYFLSRLNQQMLKKTLFPIGHLPKKDVRMLAEKIKLPNAKRPDSQGICFIGNINVSEFIKKHITLLPGLIVNEFGGEIGNHKGLELYTIGQRQGIEIGGKKDPYYVIKKNKERNELVVALGAENKALFQQYMVVSNMHWISGEKTNLKQVTVQIRYRQKAVPATLKQESNTKWCITFEEPQRAVTPGQICAIYSENECLGSGIIES